jgi:heterodisulfide reductase subunit B
MKYGYYPGCSLGHTARPYDLSTKAIAGPLDLEFEEIKDWNCCGATEYLSINRTASYALVARNLALASHQDGLEEIVAPCSACYLNLQKTDYAMKRYRKLGAQVAEALAAGGLSYEPGSLKVRHLLDVVVNDVGMVNLAEKVVKPLSGLRVAPYYGCMVVRPGLDGGAFDDPEYPLGMDALLATLGAEVVDFPLKSHCCGGHMTQISADTAFELIRRLLANAAEYQADVIVTLCPMCQLNLDAYQPQVNRHFGTDFNLPVLYFTQMIGLALGLEPEALGIGQEVVSARAALSKIGHAPETATERAKRRRDDKSLPMPGMIREG